MAAGDALGLDCVSPRDPAQRGSHISFRHPHAHAITQALIAHGVIGDFRDPDIARFGFAPLYVGEDDVERAVTELETVLEKGEHLDPAYARRNSVT